MKASPVLSERIATRIGALQENPVPHGSKSLTGKSYRIRIGDYRVIYDILWKERIVLIVNIDKRNRVYK